MELSTQTIKGFPRFRCRKEGCNEEVSILKGSWFEDCRSGIEKAVSLMYSYAYDDAYEVAIHEADEDDGTMLSTATVADWYSLCRDVILHDFDEGKSQRGKIGGPGKIVQIDESKFGKRKYDKGRKVEGHWVFAAIEDGSQDLRVTVCHNQERTTALLTHAIKRWIAPGSIIRTDGWKAYEKLGEMGYVHQVVNHSKEFVTKEGIHTNRVEAMWRPMKDHFRKIKIRSVCIDCQKKFEEAYKQTKEIDEDDEAVRKDKLANRKKLYAQIRKERGDCVACEEHEMTFANKIVEYLWRRENKKNGYDPFDPF
jgi:transposase-like protein